MILHESLLDIEERFCELHALGDAAAKAEQLSWLGRRNILGGKAFIFEGIGSSELQELGELRTPSVSDLFVAKVGA